MSLIKLLMPLPKAKQQSLNQIREFLTEEDYKKLKRLVKLGEIGLAKTSLKVSKKLIEDEEFPIVTPAKENQEVLDLTKLWNSIIEQVIRERKYKELSIDADKKIKEFIAPHIIGLDAVKEATILQLFAKDKLHILLLGDPSTGKTDILRATNELAPISSFGLGSGTSSVGLTAAINGKEVTKGLLPMADNGICCVDELNLMKARDRGSLLNAMEKGFVTYDKGNKHVRFDARISLLATANPKGDRFVGKQPETWLKQIPFDPALLTRFHLVFFIRKPNKQEFIDIAKKIVNQRERNLSINDQLFIRDYIEFSQIVDVAFNEKLKTQIVDFAAKLKQDERKFLVEISPRTILGIIRLAKASARVELRSKVEQKDLDKVFKLLEQSMYVK
jgi:DNA replicative helicase MCM subunit Mcm2 (Cdc46/Mcm family)